MGAIAARLVAWIGLPGILLAGLLVHYEGLPVLNRYPVLAAIPLIGDLAVGRVEEARLEGEREGADREKAKWIVEQAWLQAEHDARVAATQYRINAIARAAGEEQAGQARKIAELNQQLLRTSDEDFVCPAGSPVFFDGLSERLNALGRD